MICFKDHYNKPWDNFPVVDTFIFVVLFLTYGTIYYFLDHFLSVEKFFHVGPFSTSGSLSIRRAVFCPLDCFSSLTVFHL